MEYISTKEASRLWNIDVSRIAKLCRDGKLPGATFVGNRWLIPSYSIRPSDGRRKLSDFSEPEDSFRFPLFVNGSEESYFPALSDEELLLRKAQLDFYACRFDISYRNMEFLLNNSKSIYIQLSALYHLCCLSIIKSDFEAYDSFHDRFVRELDGDYPHKREMQIFMYLFDIFVDSYAHLFNNYKIDITYPYHSSVFDLMGVLSIYTVDGGDISRISATRFDTFELMCIQLESVGSYFEARLLHIIMVYIYQAQANTEYALHHIRCALNLAEKNELYFLPAKNYYYLHEAFHAVFKDFSDEFMTKIQLSANPIYEGYINYTVHFNKPTFFSKLSQNDYKFAILATQGYSYSDVAKILNVSKSYVTRRYSEIYQKLGVKNKQEFSDYFKRQ